MKKDKSLNELSNVDIANMIDGPYFLGCYAKDNVPASMWKKKGYAVINLDDHHSGGTHWCCLILGNSNYYIDSFGFAPPTQIDNGMKRTKRPSYFSDIQLQDKSSSSCGWFSCAIAIECVTKNRPVSDVLLDDFTYDTKTNEELLKRYFK
jgi:hypothetical protein